MNRIVIVGTTGAGKSTLAEQLAEQLHCPFVELDALFWGLNWRPAEREVFRARVSMALDGDRWAVGGNYGLARDIIWGRADTLIWLDYTLALVLWRLLQRTFKRIVTQEELWSGNRETWRTQFFSRDSLFLWALKSHLRHRRRFTADLARPEHAHLCVLRFHAPHETEQWLSLMQSG